MLKRLIKSFLLTRKILISRPPGQFNAFRYKLTQAKLRGLEIKCAIDAGAADGGWARELLEVYPHSVVLCIEPRADAQLHLKRLAEEFKNVKIAQTLVGDHVGQITFNQHGHQSSLLPNSKGESFGVSSTAPITTLDHLIKDQGIPAPDLIKLDLQGAELACLRGASEVLATAQAVMLECSLYTLQQGQPLVGEIMSFMDQVGYRLYDIVALTHRPLDGALVQSDFIFLKKNHRLFLDARWSAESTFS